MQPSLFNYQPPTLSISQLTTHIRHLFDSNDTLQDIWIEGEISNWSAASSGHIYFTLKDAKASIRCVIWRSTAQRLSYRPSGNGEAITARGRVSVYEKSGNYQFYVDEIQAVGAGALYIQFERLKQQLAEEGLFDEDLKKPLPTFPKRIGIVTSAQAAALQDVLTVLQRRYPVLEVILASTLVQGETAPPKIIAALNALSTLTPPVDIILLTRGGGSIEDLWAFNNEALAYAIADCPIPIVSAVGHETDFTISDFVADHRAPTPSAAAELITPDAEELQRHLSAYQQHLSNTLYTLINQHRNNLQEQTRQLNRLSPQAHIDNKRQQIDDISLSIKKSLQHQLEVKQEQLKAAQAQLSALNPNNILKRGYALVYKKETLISTTSQVSANDTLTITLADGTIETKVIK